MNSQFTQSLFLCIIPGEYRGPLQGQVPIIEQRHITVGCQTTALPSWQSNYQPYILLSIVGGYPSWTLMLRGLEKRLSLGPSPSRPHWSRCEDRCQGQMGSQGQGHCNLLDRASHITTGQVGLTGTTHTERAHYWFEKPSVKFWGCSKGRGLGDGLTPLIALWRSFTCTSRCIPVVS